MTVESVRHVGSIEYWDRRGVNVNAEVAWKGYVAGRKVRITGSGFGGREDVVRMKGVTWNAEYGYKENREEKSVL